MVYDCYTHILVDLPMNHGDFPLRNLPPFPPRRTVAMALLGLLVGSRSPTSNGQGLVKRVKWIRINHEDPVGFP